MLARASAAGASRARGQRRLDVAGRGAPGREESESNGDRDDGGQREEQDGCVDGHALLARQVGRKDGGQGADRPGGDQDSEETARHGKGQRLGQELLNETAAPGPEGRPHGQFLAAGGGAREKQAGDIGAGNEEQQADGSEKGQERGSNVADHGVGQGRHRGVDEVHVLAEAVPDAAGDRAEIRTRLPDGDAVPQASESLPVVRRAAGNLGFARNPPGDAGGKIELARHDADDRIDRPVHGQAELR